MATLTMDEREDAAVRLDDEALIRSVYETLIGIEGNDEEVDEVFLLLGEAFERWAPEAEWANNQRELREDESPDRLNRALLDAFEFRRRREAARMLYHALDEKEADDA